MISYILRMILTSHSPYTLTFNWNDVIKTADNPVWSTLLSLKILLRHCYRAYYIFIRIAGLVTNEVYHLLDGLNRFLKILHKTFATSGIFTTGNCRPHRINILCLFTSAPYNESFERELPPGGFCRSFVCLSFQREGAAASGQILQFSFARPRLCFHYTVDCLR